MRATICPSLELVKPKERPMASEHDVAEDDRRVPTLMLPRILFPERR